MPIGLEGYTPRLKAKALATLLAAVGTAFVLALTMSWLRTRHSPEEWKAIHAAVAASKRAGWWAEGYEAQSASRHEWGWSVYIDHPGNYVGGHHGVMLNHEYRLIRLLGGK